ncbi:hypothetical protein SESBI_31001 [Sesbania bispinosa]|nr:hypothetical protein SESBI_31001 [Sesbania bispinosa]
MAKNLHFNELSKTLTISNDDCDGDLVREDVPDDIIEKPLSELNVRLKENEDDDEPSLDSENESINDSSFDENP